MSDYWSLDPRTRKTMEEKLPSAARERFRLDIRKYFFTGRVFKCGTSLSREVAKSESPDIFKRDVDVTFRDLTVLYV